MGLEDWKSIVFIESIEDVYYQPLEGI